MAVSTIKMQNGSSSTSGIIKMQRCGKVRVVDINGTITSQSIATVDAPITEVHTIGRWKNTSNAYYPALVTLQTTGAISASYFNGTTVSAISNGTLVATLSYIAS